MSALGVFLLTTQYEKLYIYLYIYIPTCAYIYCISICVRVETLENNFTISLATYVLSDLYAVRRLRNEKQKTGQIYFPPLDRLESVTQ